MPLLNSYENDTREISLSLLTKLANLYGKSIDYFIGFDDYLILVLRLRAVFLFRIKRRNFHLLVEITGYDFLKL
ncbi:MAG: helix-turn-helix transcriptional regulator [Bacillota bacterium]|nr:helix-turn-helix transcriptional regulator [Bacillota bacterium]